jgi:hypothetical protein
MEPWYKIVTPRKEVREGRSFNPDEFAIALEQVVAGKAPPDYQKPEQFFARTCWTRALTDNTALVLRRLAGETANTAPVIALVTQFGGGKTHTLTALYHIFSSSKKAKGLEGIEEAMKTAGIQSLPDAKVGVFVGNAWDPAAGAETPWIALARQIAGEKGVKALGPAAKTAPPGTESLLRLYQAAGGKVLILCDEVLNFINRYRDMAEPFRLFIANLVRSMTGATGCASVISLPQSKPEMSEWDLRWQDIITKEVNRVATQLIANDESEIAVVVRRRLFQDLGQETVRQEVAKRYAAWCFERRAQLPPECTAVESSTVATKAREILRRRFEDCYPFHPATLSVFQRKWQVLHQYQQTRGTLAMLAQWIAWAYRTGFSEARQEPLITIGSAPLDVREFRGVVLGQLGEPRLAPAIDADIAGVQSHALSLDADTKNSLRNIHRRVGTAILFECSGGQKDKVAHLPELRYALGEPDLDTTSIDTAALALEGKAYFIRKIGSDGFMISHQATLKKVVHARRASLDDAKDVVPAMETAARREFERGLPAARGTAQAGASVPLVCFPEDGTSIPDTPKLTVVVVHPSNSWGGDPVRETLREWSKQRGKSPRLYPGALVFCIKKPGNELREKVELNLAWGKVASEIVEGTLGGEYDRSDRASVQARVTEAAEAVKDEVWAGYRFVVVTDGGEADGLKVVDLGAGHASSGETLCGRILTALKSQALLNESVGAGYIERNWPPALKASGAWPLASLRQSFLNGTLTRLLDPDTTLRARIVDAVSRKEFGLASGERPDGTYERVWFDETVGPEEVAFESGVFLLLKSKARLLKEGKVPEPPPTKKPEEKKEEPERPTEEERGGEEAKTKTIQVKGRITPETWNRLGTKLLPKLRAGRDLRLGIDFSVTVESDAVDHVVGELRQALTDLGLNNTVEVL